MTGTAGHRWARRTRRLLVVVAGLVAGGAAAAFGYWTVTVLYAPTNYALAQANSLSAPSVPTATVNGSGAITIGWSLPGSQLTGTQYHVTRTSGPGSPATACTVASNVTSCQDAGLAATSTYGYSIVAVLDNWQTTAITTSATTTTPTLSITLSSLSTVAGSPLTVQTITAKNGASTDSSYTGSKTMTWSGLNNSPSGFSPSYPAGAVTFASGVASPTSAFTPYEAGSSRTLTATDSNATGVTGSVAFTVTFATANKLVFTTQPVGSVAEATNLPTSPTVSVQDTFGNVATTDTGTVTLTINTGPGSGSLSCSNAGFPAVAAVAGAVAFTNCQITGTTAAGTYTLIGSRSGLTSTGASSAVVINVGAANKLVFTTQPVGAVVEATNFSTPPTVSVEDSSGNVVTTDTGTVTLARNSGPAGSLTCSNAGFPTVTAAAGVVAFTNCQIAGTAAAGTYTLAATRAGLTSTGASNNVIINVGAANKLVFTTQPVGAVVEATNLPTSPTVSVQDTFGNVATTDTGTVTLTINTGPGSGSLSCSNAGFPAVAAVAGAVAFTNCQIAGTTAAGTYTLAATRAGLTSTGASNNVIINVGAANKLVFTTQPVGAVVEATNLPTSPTVSVQDTFGNVATTDTGTVTLAKNSGPAGSLSCSALTVAAVGGVVTFTNCQITGTAAAGTYTLAGTRTGLAATGASNNVDIIADVAAGISFSNVSTNSGPATVTCTGTVGLSSFACSISPEISLGLGLSGTMTANVIRIDRFQNPVTSGASITVALSQVGAALVTPSSVTIPTSSSTSSQTFTETVALGGLLQGTVTATATVNSTAVQAKITT